MEALIIVVVLFTFWTQHILLKPEAPAPNKSNDVKDLTDALKKFLAEGLDVNIKS